MSAPYNTSPPTLEQVGSTLVAHNGGWDCDSGPVGGYLFAFTSRPVSTPTPPSPPQRETHEEARARLARWPSNTLDPVAGLTYTAWVYAVTFSGAWGSEDAWAEWSAVAVSNPVTVQAVAPLPVAQPRVVPAQQELSEVRNLLTQSYAFTHPKAQSHVAVTSAVTHLDRAEVFLRGENP